MRDMVIERKVLWVVKKIYMFVGKIEEIEVYLKENKVE